MCSRFVRQRYQRDACASEAWGLRDDSSEEFEGGGVWFGVLLRMRCARGPYQQRRVGLDEDAQAAHQFFLDYLEELLRPVFCRGAFGKVSGGFQESLKCSCNLFQSSSMPLPAWAAVKHDRRNPFGGGGETSATWQSRTRPSDRHRRGQPCSPRRGQRSPSPPLSGPGWSLRPPGIKSHRHRIRDAHNSQFGLAHTNGLNQNHIVSGGINGPDDALHDAWKTAGLATGGDAADENSRV